MNWNKITRTQNTVGTIGLIVLCIIGVLIVSFLGTALGTWLICYLMNWPWGWNIAATVYIGLAMLSGAFNGIKVNTD